MATATDIKVQRLTIRVKGKLLLENTSLTIAAGRRYGLIGPNGKGKSTVMKMLAKRQIPVPAGIGECPLPLSSAALRRSGRAGCDASGSIHVPLDPGSLVDWYQALPTLASSPRMPTQMP